MRYIGLAHNEAAESRCCCKPFSLVTVTGRGLQKNMAAIMKKCRKHYLSRIWLLFFMAAMPSSFGCKSRIKDEEVTNEYPVESGAITTDDVSPSSEDDYNYYDLHDYDNYGYVNPELGGNTTYPTIRDVSTYIT